MTVMADDSGQKQPEQLYTSCCDFDAFDLKQKPKTGETQRAAQSVKESDNNRPSPITL